MLRETSPPVWRRAAMLTACCAFVALCAGCGIKGPLKPPPGTTAPAPPPPDGVEMPSSVNRQ